MRSIHTIICLLLAAAVVTACSTVPATEPLPAPTTAPTTAPAKPPTKPPATPATVAVHYRYGDAWRPVTALSSHVPPGSAELRLTFSKAVRREEVERVLTESQMSPIRGNMQWADDRTLYWQVSQLPRRIDFLLGEAHDQDGLPLPGGISPLRTGEPPALVSVDLSTAADRPLTNVPPDIVSAALSPDRKFLNLKVWAPGSTPWDWQTLDVHTALENPAFKSGVVEGLQPRLPANLESWVLNPGGNMVAGLRVANRGERDLILSDVRGARQQVTPAFVTRPGNAGSTGVVWSADGARVAALTQSAAGADRSDMVAMDVAERTVSTLARDLPVMAGTARLAWSPDGRYVLVGSIVVDLQTGSQRALPGDAATARGVWEPGGGRLLYGSQDWGAVFVADAATGGSQPLGQGLIVDWAGPGRVYVVRWPASGTRYFPPGQ